MTNGTPRAPRAGFRLPVIAACLNTRSRYNYSIFDRALLKENYKGPVYMEKPGALTICMDNPEIPGRIHDKWNGSTPVKMFPKNSNTFPVFTETTEIFFTICLDYYCQASCREKAKNLLVFCR